MGSLAMVISFQRLATVNLVGSRSGQGRGVGNEVLGDDLVGECEVAVPHVSPRGSQVLRWLRWA
jgi:hypothetical protein